MVRMVVRTNDVEPDHPAYGERPYYDDEEMPRVIREWFDGALDDRDDGPHITWSEFRLKAPAPEQEKGS